MANKKRNVSGNLPKLNKGDFGDRVDKKIEIKKLVNLDSIRGSLNTIQNKTLSDLIKSTNTISEQMKFSNDMFSKQFRIENRRFLDGLDDSSTSTKENKDKKQKPKVNKKPKEDGMSLLELLGLKQIIGDVFGKVKNSKIMKYIGGTFLGKHISGFFGTIFKKMKAYMRLFKYNPAKILFAGFKSIAKTGLALVYTAITAALSLGTAFNPEEVKRISGVDKEKQKWYHQLGSGLASFTSSISMGLFGTDEEIYQFVNKKSKGLQKKAGEWSDTFLGLFNEETFNESRDKIIQGSESLFKTIQGKIQEVGESVKNDPQMIGLGNMLDGIFGPMKEYMEGKGENGGIRGLFNKDIPDALNFLSDIGNSLVKPLKEAKENLVRDIGEGPIGEMIDSIGNIVEYISGLFQTIKDKVERVAEFLGIDIENSKEKEERLKREEKDKVYEEKVKKMMSQKTSGVEKGIGDRLSWQNAKNKLSDLEFHKTNSVNQNKTALRAYIKSDDVDMEEKIKAYKELERISKPEIPKGDNKQNETLKDNKSPRVSMGKGVQNNLPKMKNKTKDKLNTIENMKGLHVNDVVKSPEKNGGTTIINEGDTITNISNTTLSGERFLETHSIKN